MSHRVIRLVGIVLLLSSFLVHANEETNSIGHFDIVQFDVQGNTLLTSQEINQALMPYAGKDRDFGSVQQAVEALELAYRQKGFEVVQVVLPEQELMHGVVQLQVIETRIGKINVEGNTHFDETNIRNSLPALKEGQTPNMAQVSASLKVANENPAKKTTVQLQSGDEVGVADAKLQVADENPWLASLSVDNTGDRQTGRNRITGMVQNANLGGLDHVLGMQYTTSMAHPNDVNVFGVGYHLPLYRLGDSLDFYGSYSNVNSGTVTAGVFSLAVSGNGTVYGTRYNHNFLKSGNYDSALSGGIDYKAYTNDIRFFETPLGNDITVHPLSATYSGNWTPSNTTVNFFLTGVRNIPGGNNGGDADFSLARSGANANYSLFRYGVTYLHAFSEDWQLRFSLNGQITSDALIPGEQFGMGGAASVRGFLEREIANDQGRITNLELYTPNLCSSGAKCRALSFYDTGYTSRNDALPNEKTQESIGSIGLGFRMSLALHWAMQADFAHVIDGSDMTPKGSNRAHFKLSMTF